MKHQTIEWLAVAAFGWMCMVIIGSAIATVSPPSTQSIALASLRHAR